MELRDYIKRLSVSQVAAFASRSGTTVGHLKQIAYGHRRASVGLAVAFDRESEGQVRCETLRPDIDWAYLKSKSAAA